MDYKKKYEEQGEPKADCPQNHQDINRPNGCIVLEDFNGGEGFYKLHLDYLNNEQVKEVEALILKWNITDEDIRNCIGLCLTDVDEQRFKDFNTNLRDCLAWLEKQGEPTEINPSEFDLRLNKLLKQFEKLSKEELANSLDFYLNVVQNDGTYKPEKQGNNEQILANSAKTCKDEPKQGWSEEDDYNVQCCIAKAVADMQTGNVERNNELIEWLKSLKERLSL